MARKHEQAIAHLCACDPRMAAHIATVPDDRQFRLLKSEATVFEALMEAIIYQQLAGKAAKAILERVKGLFPVHGEMKVTRHGQGLPFPTPEQVVKAPERLLRSGGLSQAKMLAIKDLAAKVLDGTVPDMDAMRKLSDEEIIERLVQVRGIGRWTAEMLLIFDLGRMDVFPIDDYGVRKGFAHVHGKRDLPKPKAMLKIAEKWRPYRSVASWYLWRAAEMHQPRRAKKKVAKKAVAKKRTPAKKVVARKAQKTRSAAAD